MATLLDLGPDELLSTTRAVRKRLDLERPVELEVVKECVEVAFQAPTGSNAQGWHFLVVTDAAKRARLAELYNLGFQMFYGDTESAIDGMPQDDPAYIATQRKVVSSAQYLAAHLAEVPVHVIPIIEGRLEQGPVAMQASIWGSLLPAAWSFCLAARARGLGTCWTTLHLIHEQEAAELLGIPDNVMQGALLPVAYTKGTDFKPGARRDIGRYLHIDTW
ncbi:MAG: nitroreductase family protein [Acidimicrobiales bacterium]